LYKKLIAVRLNSHPLHLFH